MTVTRSGSCVLIRVFAFFVFKAYKRVMKSADPLPERNGVHVDERRDPLRVLLAILRINNHFCRDPERFDVNNMHRPAGIVRAAE